jgi:hypothetical protein
MRKENFKVTFRLFPRPEENSPDQKVTPSHCFGKFNIILSTS